MTPRAEARLLALALLAFALLTLAGAVVAAR